MRGTARFVPAIGGRRARGRFDVVELTCLRGPPGIMSAAGMSARPQIDHRLRRRPVETRSTPAPPAAPARLCYESEHATSSPRSGST